MSKESGNFFSNLLRVFKVSILDRLNGLQTIWYTNIFFYKRFTKKFIADIRSPYRVVKKTFIVFYIILLKIDVKFSVTDFTMYLQVYSSNLVPVTH